VRPASPWENCFTSCQGGGRSKPGRCCSRGLRRYCPDAGAGRARHPSWRRIPHSENRARYAHLGCLWGRNPRFHGQHHRPVLPVSPAQKIAVTLKNKFLVRRLTLHAKGITNLREPEIGRPVGGCVELVIRGAGGGSACCGQCKAGQQAKQGGECFASRNRGTQSRRDVAIHLGCVRIKVRQSRRDLSCEMRSYFHATSRSTLALSGSR